MMPVNRLQYFGLIIEKDKVQHARYMKLERLSVKITNGSRNGQ